MGLIDALIALAILAFGLLALTRLQGRLVAQATESQTRLVATQLGDELLSTALVDVGNAACYTLPQAGACGSANAEDGTADWADRVEASLPGPVTATSTLDGPGERLTVVITWQGKASGDTRSLTMTTDVRP
ncbi:MAG: pilus assembly protein PilV [Rubrivivax sp.]|nr:pilus assembly protein PilV [Rubrivivax sp.]